MFTLNRRQIATFFLVVLLLTIPFHLLRVFPEKALSVYRIVNLPILFLALIFFLKEDKIKFRLLSPILVISLLFVIWTLFTCIFSKDIQASSLAWFRYIFQYFLLAFVTFLCIKVAWSKRLFVIIANLMQIIGLILAISLFLNFFFNIKLEVFATHTTLTDTASLAGGTFRTIFKLAVALSMSMFLFFYYKKEKQIFKSFFSLFASIMCLGALFMSGSRLAGIIGLFLIFMLVFRQGYALVNQKPVMFMSILTGVVILCIIGSLFISGRFSNNLEIERDNKYIEKIYNKIEKYLNVFEEIKTGQVRESSSLGQRLSLIKEIPKVFDQAPIKHLTFGIGFWQFSRGAENAYLSFFVETGIIGGLLFLALVVQIGRTIYRQYRKSENNDFCFYLGIAFLSMTIFFLFEPTLEHSLIWRFFIPLTLFFEQK